MMFQDPYASLDPRMRVAAILREPLIVQGIGTAKDQRQRIGKMLDEVGLPLNALERYPHEFSGGQRQRIGLARALMLEPKVIVADEPVSALDVSIRSQVLNLMKRLQAEHHMASVVISHDLAVVKYLADRIGVMYLGKLVEVGSGEDIYRRPAHPYTDALIKTIPVPDPAAEKAKTEVGIRGELPSPINPPSGCRFRTRCPRAQSLCAEEEPPLRAFGPRPSGRLSLPAADAHGGRIAVPVSSSGRRIRPTGRRLTPRPTRRRSIRRLARLGRPRRLTVLVPVVVIDPQRLGRELCAVAVPELDVEVVAAVVVGRQQREPLLDERALVDRQVGQFGGDDRAAADHRHAPDQRDVGDVAVLALPAGDDLVVEVEVPVGVGVGGLGGEVRPGLELRRRAAGCLGERHEPEQLVAGRRARHRRHVGAPAVGAIGEPGDLAGLAEVLAVGVQRAAGAEEMGGERVGPAAVR